MSTCLRVCASAWRGRVGVNSCSLRRAVLPQLYQWLEVCLRADIGRVEILDRLNSFLADTVFLTGHRVSAVDLFTFYVVHPVVVRDDVCAWGLPVDYAVRWCVHAPQFTIPMSAISTACVLE
jgi:hypothetical protein